MVVGPDWDARPNSSDGLGGTTVPTDEDGDKLADNLKRPAILNVKRVLDVGCDSLDANPGGGMAPKSELLTEGLGGKGKIWQSPLADNYRDEIRCRCPGRGPGRERARPTARGGLHERRRVNHRGGK